MVRLAAAFAFLAVAAAPAPAPQAWNGVWANPSNSVHIRAQKCGAAMCGIVVWANDKAKKDAAAGGTANLIGTQLFSGFRPASDGSWAGSVFVPDLNRTVSGTIQLQGGNNLIATGCLLGQFGCVSQTWKRVS